MRNFEKIFRANTPNSRRLERISEWEGVKDELKEYYCNICPVKSMEDESHPGVVEASLSKLGENAYQRAFFIGRKVVLKRKASRNMKIEWLDLEIPVSLERSKRKHCLDMIGKAGRSFVIAELKDVQGTSPFDAMREVLFYALCAKVNNKGGRRLAAHSMVADSKVPDYWQDYSNARYLVISAPTTYWERWKGFMDKVTEVAGWIQDRWHYRIILAQFEPINFKRQKKGKLYEPHYTKELVWEEI